jgi:hypothetical protein
MNGFFVTAILQYHHSIAVGEVMNVGVLLIFPAQRKLSLLYPSSLHRLTEAYPNVPQKVLKDYFKGMSNRIAKLNQKQPEELATLADPTKARQFIANELLAEDSSVLQFGSVRLAVLYTDELAQIEQRYRNQYLAYYQPETVIGKKDDAFLLKGYKDRLRANYLDINELVDLKLVHNKFKIDINDQRSFSFDFAWQNGSTNIVVPLSFDLQRKESILRKATLHFGTFFLLKDEVERNNYRLDVLVGKPQNPALSKPYDEALVILGTANNVAIIEETGIDQYSAKTVAELQKKRNELNQPA